MYIRIPPALLERRRRRTRQQQRGVSDVDSGVVLDAGDDVMESSAAAAAAAATAAGALADDIPAENPQGGFVFLGAIANDKQSAIFRVRIRDPGDDAGGGPATHAPDGDVMVDDPTAATLSGTGIASSEAEPGLSSEDMTITLGISLEPIDDIRAQLAALHSAKAPEQSLSSSQSGSLVRTSGPTFSPTAPSQTASSQNPQYQLQLARRIITNAFNFLASFSTTTSTASASSSNMDPRAIISAETAEVEEMVPLRAFRDWWTKFEKKIQLDPGFLDRDDG